ncbi:MAG: YciE/YciF ferroxidase family protein [Armatimonadota bacterium]
MPTLLLNSLHDLFVVELNDIVDVEQEIVEALPKMIETASTPELKERFQQHLEITREQLSRLSQVFEYLGIQPDAEPSEGVAGILREGEKLMQAEGNLMAKDAALIATAQKVEHYQIAAYGTLRSFARTLGYEEISRLLQETLREEFYTDDTLTRVAERSVNRKAA